MSSITIQNYVEGVLANATSVKLRSGDGTFGIRKTIDGTIVVTPTAAITPTSTGVYSYSTSAITTPAEYEAVFEVINGADTDYFSLLFDIDAAESVLPGPTIAEIEAEVAQRVGPYAKHLAASGTVANFVVIALQSAAQFGGYEDRYILRRGLKNDGTRVPGFTDEDRVRIVFEYDYATGTITPDRSYTTAPTADEIIEFPSLHPDQITFAVLRGLERAEIMDIATITLSGAAVSRDFTALAPWLRYANQVKEIEAGYGSSLLYPSKTGWMRRLVQQGKVVLRTSLDPYPNQAIVHALRPIASLVNGSDSLIGPQDDTDYVHAPLALCAAAGHIECWRYYPEDMANRSTTGKKPTQSQTAQVFTMEQNKVIKGVDTSNDQLNLEWSAQGSSLGLIP